MKEQEKTHYIEYGLHPSIWRKIRKTHSGLIEIDIKSHQSEIIGKGLISRYISTIFLENTIEFKDMSIKYLLEDTKNLILDHHLSGNNIPICLNRY